MSQPPNESSPSNVDMSARLQQDASAQQSAAPAPATTGSGELSKLKTVIAKASLHLFNLCAKHENGIKNMSFKFGNTEAEPYHMLLVSDAIVYGFQHANDDSKKQAWRFDYKTQSLHNTKGICNGVPPYDTFKSLIKQTRDAIKNQDAFFSRDTTKEEIDGIWELFK